MVSLLACIPRKGGSIRITMNDKRLNAASIMDSYPLPKIDDLVDSPGAGRIYSDSDLLNGLFQLAIDFDSIAVTACITPRDLYNRKCMP